MDHRDVDEIRPDGAVADISVRRRPGGRSERVRLAVAQAVLEMIRDGQTDFGVTEVAERAGIHRSTVYRRWPTRAELVTESLTLHTSRLHIADTGSWDDDVRTTARELARFFADPVELAMNAAMASARDPELSDAIVAHWTPLVDALGAIVHRAIERGELAAEADPRVLVDLLTGPLLAHTLLMREHPDDGYVDRLVGAVLRALPRSDEAPRRDR